EYVVHHARGQLARVRVLTAGVIAADEHLSVRQPVNDAMAERGTRLDDDAAALQQLEVRVEPDLSKCNDDADVGQRGDLGVEMREAVGDLVRGRLVGGRRAADRGGDER